jgi:hypothetical protein
MKFKKGNKWGIGLFDFVPQGLVSNSVFAFGPE